MIDAIPEDERIITVEERSGIPAETPDKLHLLYSQGDQGVAQISQKDLQRASLRSRPDRVLVQELLDSEAAATYVEEVVSGHPGSITTIHGRDAAQAFKRLFNMVKASGAGSAQEDATVVGMLASVVDVIIPFRNDAAVFSIGEVWFAPDAARRGEGVANLLRDVD
jgi:type IV secretion system protein VirB11